MFLYAFLGCENGWTEYEKNCYRISATKRFWNDAKYSCQGQDSNLASIHSTEEQNFILTLFPVTTIDVWIGGKLGAFDFEWIDGSNFGYKNWKEDEPNYDGECIEMFITDGGLWMDYDCYEHMYYVCKKGYRAYQITRCVYKN